MRILLVQASPGLAQGVRDAISMIGARTVTDVSQADLVVTAQQAAAATAARENPGTHVLVVGPRPAGAVAANVRVVEFDRGQLAYLAGALAALSGRDVAVAEPGIGALRRICEPARTRPAGAHTPHRSHAALRPQPPSSTSPTRPAGRARPPRS